QFRGAGRLRGAWALLRGALPGGPAAWRYARRLAEAVRAAGPDLVHSNGIKTHLLTRCAVPPGTPVLWHAHDFFGTRPVVARGLPVRFYVAGGPVYQTQGSQFSADELRGLAARLGLAGRVGFISFREDTAALYRALDVVVHASTQPEPFGLTVIEAMGCGRPVI